ALLDINNSFTNSVPDFIFTFDQTPPELVRKPQDSDPFILTILAPEHAWKFHFQNALGFPVRGVSPLQGYKRVKALLFTSHFLALECLFLNSINMASVTHAVSFFLVVVICIQQNNGQTVPDRCRCLTTSNKPSKWKNIEEFSITPPRSRCKVTEIIVTLKIINPKTKQKEQRCISPDIYQSVYLQECWN
ncbi:C-X-C motif chemokine 11-like, partial [Clarias magur]